MVNINDYLIEVLDSPEDVKEQSHPGEIVPYDVITEGIGEEEAHANG